MKDRLPVGGSASGRQHTLICRRRRQAMNRVVKKAFAMGHVAGCREGDRSATCTCVLMERLFEEMTCLLACECKDG